MIWTAGFRTAVISPYEQIQLTEPRAFADHRSERDDQQLRYRRSDSVCIRDLPLYRPR